MLKISFSYYTNIIQSRLNKCGIRAQIKDVFFGRQNECGIELKVSMFFLKKSFAQNCAQLCMNTILSWWYLPQCSKNVMYKLKNDLKGVWKLIELNSNAILDSLVTMAQLISFSIADRCFFFEQFLNIYLEDTYSIGILGRNLFMFDVSCMCPYAGLHYIKPQLILN